ncbi:histone-lysine N-methyltransferase, H3 lysine-9 specific SUVH5-like [Mercurialis annua]|uniref:histone-lysine N-methyltransferase, H3 lysine-9 specific SUVH5-like n=1 Tax=Mercurialis annua TaxID=3986 RepID=UPI002160F726|nr:histone-lysine N-methyltransferase, H3 lysine-9 specific SUVH5-like [Mercurialis annua]
MHSSSKKLARTISDPNENQNPRKKMLARRDFPPNCSERGSCSTSINSSNEGSSSAASEHVKQVLKLFRETLDRLEKEAKSKGKRANGHMHKYAVTIMGKSNLVNSDKRLGHVPGVEAGERFHYMAELYVTGVHLQLQRGIDYLKEGGMLLATSIVATDHHSNYMKSADVLVYAGEGGKDSAKDQVLERGNLALKNSWERKKPVRVVLTVGLKSCKGYSSDFNYCYDGLYMVEDVKKERGKLGKFVFKFQLKKMSGQEEVLITRGSLHESVKGVSRKEIRILNDISNGREKIPIPVVNKVDGERPLPFTYIADISDPEDQNHSLSTVCDGPDRSIQLQLEVFKTVSKGWGLRSRSYIRAGTFICEYVGTIVESKESYSSSGSDEYLFDAGDDYDDRIRNTQAVHEKEWGFTIDAGEYGNVGRFINHSCSSNLQVQNVLDGSKFPHVMLYAKKDIAPQTELTYDYNCRLAEARYMNGSVKAKICMCKSVNCAGKFY